MHQLQDPITLRALSDQERVELAQTWATQWQEFLAKWPASDPKEACQKLYEKLSEASRGESGQAPKAPLCPHAPDSYLPDHTLLTSAIAYCLAFEDEALVEQDRLLLRLAALSHELPHPTPEKADTPDLRARLGDLLAEATDRSFLDSAWRLLDEQGELLASAAGKENSLAAFAGQQPETGDRRLDLLWYAHLATSQPLFNRVLKMPEDEPSLYVIENKVDFDAHPLNRVPGPWKEIGLVHGGATKIKGYVFESARLPEIRGASALLDRLNLEDTRALFGEANGRTTAVPPLIDAPECVIYANGGDVLALAPASKAQELADALERRYTHETLTAQCVAVAGTYDLLELQYGLRPGEFWYDDYRQQLDTTDEQGRKLLRSYYSDPQHDGGRLNDECLFHLRKGFGELTTTLALKRFWRREGNEGTWNGDSPTTIRSLPHFETLPFGQRCSSCDRRIAFCIARIGTDERPLCDPCYRKLNYGRKKKGGWALEFESFLDQHEPWKQSYLKGRGIQSWKDVEKPEDLDQIGLSARRKGFIGLIYADGNNVGALIERIRAASFYRQFAGRLFEAIQAAVFTALATHLQAARITDENGNELLIHPFEIVSIGGDDLILIVPADKALDIALDIASFLEEVFHDGNGNYQDRGADVQRYQPHRFQASGKPRISLSAGVVLAQKDNPIFFLNDLVQELLKSAKVKAKQLKEKGYYGGTMDFMALKSVTMVTSSVSEFRETALREVKRPAQGDGCEVLHLTARPYTLHELRGLLHTAAALKKANFPRSQLYHLRQELAKGRFVSSLSYLYFTSRLRPTHPALVQRALDRSWHVVTDPVPWRKRSSPHNGQPPAVQEWESVLADIVEIYDFVPALGEAEERSGDQPEQEPEDRLEQGASHA